MTLKVLVPRFLDEANTNAQNLNTKALLSRFQDSRMEWWATHYDTANSKVAKNKRVRLVRLWRGRLSRLRMFLFYLQRAEVLFYPGGVPKASLALRIGRLLQPNRIVIATFEGLAGSELREKELGEIAGHPVYCHRIPEDLQQRLDEELATADHVIAISPFLARVGSHLYGDKFTVLPLGIDLSIFHPPLEKPRFERPVVVSAGAVKEHKRPEIFIELAKRHPEADFIWFGNGDSRVALQTMANDIGLNNLQFPGSFPPEQLANAFRNADLFVMPSKSEGVPKVTQEAAACGLPVILFGYYEAPSVVNSENGFVVWDDTELFYRVKELLDKPEIRRRMGACGARMARDLSWDVIAPIWENKIKELLKKID
jgi:glycosyltransferase involved in cell wall biosynthesis